MDYRKIIIDNFKRRTIEEKKLTISLGEDLICLFNSKLNHKILSEIGEVEFMKNVIAYGYDEILQCMNIVFEKYGNQEAEEIYSKFCGIIYNRNEKLYLEYI